MKTKLEKEKDIACELLADGYGEELASYECYINLDKKVELKPHMSSEEWKARIEELAKGNLVERKYSAPFCNTKCCGCEFADKDGNCQQNKSFPECEDL